jgi:hypothetical protein
MGQGFGIRQAWTRRSQRRSRLARLQMVCNEVGRTCDLRLCGALWVMARAAQRGARARLPAGLRDARSRDLAGLFVCRNGEGAPLPRHPL